MLGAVFTFELAFTVVVRMPSFEIGAKSFTTELGFTAVVRMSSFELGANSFTKNSVADPSIAITAKLISFVFIFGANSKLANDPLKYSTRRAC